MRLQRELVAVLVGAEMRAADDVVDHFEIVAHVAEPAEEERAADRLVDDVAEAVARHDGGDGFADGVGDIAGEGGRPDRRAADAGDRQRVYVTSATQLVFRDAVADGQHGTAARRHDHDQAFGGKGIADVEGFLCRQRFHVVEQRIEAGIAQSPGFERCVAGRPVLEPLRKAQASGKLGQTQGECGLEHRSSPGLCCAAQYHSSVELANAAGAWGDHAAVANATEAPDLGFANSLARFHDGSLRGRAGRCGWPGPGAGPQRVWRNASPAIIAADIATLIERCPSTIGMMMRASALSWTVSGTPALSRPNSRMSSGR